MIENFSQIIDKNNKSLINRWVYDAIYKWMAHKILQNKTLILIMITIIAIICCQNWLIKICCLVHTIKSIVFNEELYIALIFCAIF